MNPREPGDVRKLRGLVMDPNAKDILAKPVHRGGPRAWQVAARRTLTQRRRLGGGGWRRVAQVWRQRSQTRHLSRFDSFCAMEQARSAGRLSRPTALLGSLEGAPAMPAGDLMGLEESQQDVGWSAVAGNAALCGFGDSGS